MVYDGFVFLHSAVIMRLCLYFYKQMMNQAERAIHLTLIQHLLLSRVRQCSMVLFKKENVKNINISILNVVRFVDKGTAGFISIGSV